MTKWPDGFLDGLAAGVRHWAQVLRRMHSGLVNAYALLMVVGALLVLWGVIALALG